MNTSAEQSGWCFYLNPPAQSNQAGVFIWAISSIMEELF
jgi:hypothetical protein